MNIIDKLLNRLTCNHEHKEVLGVRTRNYPEYVRKTTIYKCVDCGKKIAETEFLKFSLQ